MIRTITAKAEHHGVLPAQPVTQPGSNEDTRDGYAPKEKLPFSCSQNAPTLHHTRNDGTGEHSIWKGHLH